MWPVGSRIPAAALTNNFFSTAFRCNFLVLYKRKLANNYMLRLEHQREKILSYSSLHNSNSLVQNAPLVPVPNFTSTECPFIPGSKPLFISVLEPGLQIRGFRICQKMLLHTKDSNSWPLASHIASLPPYLHNTCDFRWNAFFWTNPWRILILVGATNHD